MGFQKAKREQIWVKILLNSPSGGGKTYSALRVATGMAKKYGSRVAAIDTENGRIKYITPTSSTLMTCSCLNRMRRRSTWRLLMKRSEPVIRF